MADLGNLHFGVHLKDYTDAEADKIKKKLESLSVHLKIDGKNVTISQTDLIKKQIEDAIKSVSVQSVKIDTSSLKAQMNTALQGIAPQISVTLLKGSLGTDLQNYLNSKTFNIGISITQSSAQNAVKTAFANFSVPVNVTVSASAALQQLRQSLASRNVKVGVEAKDVNAFVADVEAKLKNKKVKVAVEPDRQHLVQAMKQALQGVSVKAQVKVDVDAQAITNAVQRAINNANFTYSPNGRGGRGNANANSVASSQRNLGNAYNYAAQGAYQSARASVTLGRSLSTNIRIAGELGTALGTLASMFGIKDLVQGVVQIGGQLENQRIALGAILQDGGKAVEMFGKIQSLAVKSPFGIMDLNQYTKQLSAYGIEYNELYDTMKRMADISAGVGVDMGRIILAFGQVKAAGFLKGTELRQFTEANIPMVEKLAEKFSLLERRIVSAGEVYDMISEKKVTFEDVKDVLWGLTDEGGMFNNMQEVLSESLASKWKNLSDAIDVMYGKMADGRIGSWAKSLAEGLTELTKNWEYVAAAIGSATTAYTTYKVVSALGGRQIAKAHSVYTDFLQGKRTEANDLRLASSYRELTRAEQQLIATTGKLTALDARRLVQSGVLTKEMALQLIATKKLDATTKSYLTGLFRIDQQMVATAGKANWFRRAMLSVESAFRGIGAAMKGLLLNPWTWVFAAGTALAEWWADSEKKQAEIEERNRNFAESAKGSAETLERELLKIKGLDIASLNPDEMKVKVKEFTTIIKNEADGWQSILSEIFAKEADGTFKNSVEEQLKMLKTKMDELAEAKKRLMKDDESYSDVIGETKTGVLFWEKDIIDRVKAYSQAVDENDKKLKELAIHVNEVSVALETATAGNIGIQKLLEGKNLNEQVALLKDYKTEWSKFVVELTKSSPEAAQIVNSWYNSIEKFFVKGKHGEMLWDFNLAKNKMVDELTLQGEEVGELTEAGRQYVLGFVNGLIKEASVQKPKVQQYIYDWFTGQFGLPRNDLSYKTDDAEEEDGEKYDPSKDEVAKLWKKRAEEIDKAVKMYDQWKKLEGSDKARARVQAKDELANLFSGAYGFNLDLENPTKAYEFIQSKLNKNLSAQKELMVQLGVKISDAEFKDAQDKLKANMELLKREAEKTIQGWDLYKQLFEATGDKKTSMNIAFGGQISFKDKLEHLRSQIESEMGKLGATIPFEKLIGMDTKDLESKGLGGLSDLIEKYNRENAKLKEESVKNFIDIIEASKDFAAQIEDIERNLEKDLKDLRANANGADTSRAEAQLRKNAAEAISKVNFEEFKQSSDWIRVFDDLDGVSNATLDNMIKNIERFARQTDLTQGEVKQLIEALRKLREETVDRNPFKAFKNSWGDLKELKNAVKGTSNGKTNYTVTFSDGTIKQYSEEEYNDALQKALGGLNQSALGVVNKFSAVGQAADMLAGLFGDSASALRVFADVINNTMNSAASGANIGSAFGGAGGLYGAIAGAAIGFVSSVFSAHDKSMQRIIELAETRKKISENISSNLEASLERMMGGVYTLKLDDNTRAYFDKVIESGNNYMQAVADLKNGLDGGMKTLTTLMEGTHYSEDTLNTILEALEEDSYYDAQLANLKIQRDEVMKQLSSEQSKGKDEDAAKVEDYKQEIEELNVAIEYFAQDMANALYGIDFKDWAGQITDSIVEAWANGEDAAKAYEETVSDIMRNVAAKMAQQAIIEQYMNTFLKPFLEEFAAKNGVMDADMYSELANIVDGTGDRIEQVQLFLEELEKVMNEKGLSLKTDVNDSSSLSKGIQSVTEDTANLLGSYLNSIRQSVSVKQHLVEKLIGEDIPKINYLAEAQLRELSQIQTNTARNVVLVGEIRDLVNRVVDKGSNKLKV